MSCMNLRNFAIHPNIMYAHSDVLIKLLTHNMKQRNHRLSVSPQASILMGELASQFSVLQHQVDDPFLVSPTR